MQLNESSENHAAIAKIQGPVQDYTVANCSVSYPVILLHPTVRKLP